MGRETLRCRATFTRSSVPTGSYGGGTQTILLSDIVHTRTGILLTYHQRFLAGEWNAPLMADDIFEFDAEVVRYVKGYLGENLQRAMEAPAPSLDRRLSEPRNVRLIKAPRNDAIRGA
jgi:hypothetical protein